MNLSENTKNISIFNTKNAYIGTIFAERERERERFQYKHFFSGVHVSWHACEYSKI
jgi:hypothetical protein